MYNSSVLLGRPSVNVKNVAGVVIVLWQLCWPAAAQWLNYPTKGTPRTADGKPNLTAPAPRRSDGKPDLTGLWMGVPKYMINIAADLKPEEVPFQPWAAAEYNVAGTPKARMIPARCACP